MHELIIPNQIKISEIINNGSLSPNNYKKLTIKNKHQHKLEYYLNDENPFTKGIEPGSSSYVKHSNQAFLRNSCIDNIRYSLDKKKYIYLNPTYYYGCNVENEDVLFCTDANIGDCCLYISDEENVLFSSGVIKLNFKDNNDKFYLMAFMRDDYFRQQLNTLTPKGSTIRHSGDLLLQCFVPDCPYDWVKGIMEDVIKNIAYSEYYCDKKIRYTEDIIHKEIMKTDYSYTNPTFKDLKEKVRTDSGIYSNKVYQWKKNVENYKYGYTDLSGYGFKTQRGPSLQVRDLGRSIQTKKYHKGYNILIYPSDISSAGYINKVTYLGARIPVWFLDEKYILFSSEGTIGKTFVICDNTMKFTTNIHGTMIYPLDKETDISYSIFLGLYLNYLRKEGIFSKMSVGANGGSFAVGYWDNIVIPKVPSKLREKLGKIYDNDSQLLPTKFDLEKIKKAGIYQLNKFLISTKELLCTLCNDIKEGIIKSKEEYDNIMT